MNNSYDNFCKVLMTFDEWYILDTETTGLHDGEICQIAIIDNTGQVHFDTYIKTVQPIPQDATRIHGITDDMVKDSPTWATMQPIIANFLQGKICVVYNAVYDRKMMHKSNERAGLEKYDWKEHTAFYCAMEAYAEFYGQWNDYRDSYTWQSLVNAVGQCDLKVNAAHSALGDCLMTLEVVRTMTKAFMDKQLDD